MLFNQNFSFHPAASVKTCGSVASTVPIKTQDYKEVLFLTVSFFPLLWLLLCKTGKSFFAFYIIFCINTKKNKSLKKRKTEGEKVSKTVMQKKEMKTIDGYESIFLSCFFLYNLSWEWRCYEVTPATVQGESGQLVALLYVSCTAWSPIGRAYVGLKGPITGFGRDRVRYWLKQ